MSQRLIIVVRCTNRKSEAVAPELRLRDVAAGRLDGRFADWSRRLATSAAGPVEAQKLYQGRYWSRVRSVVQKAANSGFAVELWICSAGYGLIPGHAAVKPYSATFSSGKLDSIGPGAAQWWQELSSWRPAFGRTIS